jgi:hypothetical protein
MFVQEADWYVMMESGIYEVVEEKKLLEIGIKIVILMEKLVENNIL